MARAARALAESRYAHGSKIKDAAKMLRATGHARMVICNVLPDVAWPAARSAALLGSGRFAEGKTPQRGAT